MTELQPSSKNQDDKTNKPPVTDTEDLGAFLRAVLVPMIIMKAFILFFGINYALYPGEGYGYGLIVAIIVTLMNFAIFIWNRRNQTYD
ncbi:MAG TPA: hypothetical protein PLU50_01380 [Pseudobdellovibrionaceae bacterium]|jgi:uncharacterized RDD family membrane protein YckC|nr:hypothetical protein [Pseudobdellovibrionaceae bacterium]